MCGKCLTQCQRCIFDWKIILENWHTLFLDETFFYVLIKNTNCEEDSSKTFFSRLQCNLSLRLTVKLQGSSAVVINLNFYFFFKCLNEKLDSIIKVYITYGV